LPKKSALSREDTEADLAKAEPAVEAAMSALNTLDQKGYLGACKGMVKPPSRSRRHLRCYHVLACLLALCRASPSKRRGKSRSADGTWPSKKQLMSSIKE
jgi:dynein heavy chain